jgi:hypothetical protein
MLSFATVSLLVHMIDGVAARVMCVTCGAAWSTANKGMRQSPLYTSKRCTGPSGHVRSAATCPCYCLPTRSLLYLALEADLGVTCTLQLQQPGVEDSKANAAQCACFAALAALRAVCGAVAAAARSAALPLRASVVAGLWAVIATLRLALRQQDVAGPSKVRSRAVRRGGIRS